MNWCFFCFFMVFRCFNFISAHLVWAYTMWIQCLYFQLWKSYDILWIWMHLILCICLPKLRHDNIFLLAVRLVYRKFKSPSKRWKELFKLQWVSEESHHQGTIEEGEAPQSPEKSDRLASAISLALFLLRLRVSLAILLGNLRHKFLDIFDSEDSRPRGLMLAAPYRIFGPLSNLFFLSLWIDGCLLWVMSFWAVCRQCRLCCQLGCCKFYLWVFGLIVIGAVAMETPMYYVLHRLDNTWCSWDEIFFPSKNSSVISKTTEKYSW